MGISIHYRGGARLDGFNASYPFVTLSGNRNELTIRYFGRRYTFPKKFIQKLSIHRGFSSVGLRIEHSIDSYPDFVVFWVSILPWSSRMPKLKADLVRLGYNLHP